MVLTRMNLIQAVGCIVSILLYLFLPVLSIIGVPFGFTGEFCIRYDAVYLIPLILLLITLILSFLPMGPFGSIAGIVAAFGLLIFGTLNLNPAADQLERLAQLAGLTSGQASQLSYVASFVTKMGIGLLLAIITMFAASIISLVLGLVLAGQSGPSRRYAGGSAGYASHRQTRPGGVGRSSAPASHRSRAGTTHYRR